MADSLTNVNFVLKAMCDQHADVELDMHDGFPAHRRTDGGVEFILRPRRRGIHRVVIPGQELMLAHASDTVAIVTDYLARGAAAMRGDLLRALVMGTDERPLDLLGGDAPTEELLQRAERLAVKLMELVDKTRKSNAG